MTERQIQRAIIGYLRRVLPGAIVHHSANGIPLRGNRIAMSNAKLDGMIPGFPDVLTLWRGRAYCIEVKAKAGSLSKSQKQMAAQMEAQGIPFAVCRSIDETRETLAGWGVETVEQRGNETC